MTDRFLAWVWRDSRRRISVVLFIVWLLSLARFGDVRHVVLPPVIVVFGCVLDAVFLRLLRGRWMFPSSASVTSWLVALTIDPTSGIAPMTVGVLLALASKYVLRMERHWFNPAAFGIAISALAFRIPVAWWAVSWSWIPAVVLIVGTVPILSKLKRLSLPLAFLLVYVGWILVETREPAFVRSTLTDGTVLLFSLVMLPEPATSPAHGWWKYTFGPLVAILAIAVSWFLRFALVELDVFLASLLIANAVSRLARLRRKA